MENAAQTGPNRGGDFCCSGTRGGKKGIESLWELLGGKNHRRVGEVDFPKRKRPDFAWWRQTTDRGPLYKVEEKGKISKSYKAQEERAWGGIGGRGKLSENRRTPPLAGFSHTEGGFGNTKTHIQSIKKKVSVGSVI